MKTQLGLLFSIFVFTVSNAQIGFQENIITDNTDGTNGATHVYSADIDGDGDMDLISASYKDNKIAWYENLDGQGNFGSQNVISTNAMGANSVYAADLDGDGDIDVLSASIDDDKVVWYENLNGSGNFGTQQGFPLGSYGNTYRARLVFAADLDGDTDRDVIALSEDKISWWENVNGQGSFSDQQFIGDTFSPTSITLNDIDGDGDIDVAAASYGSIDWYENDGNGNFLRATVNSNLINGRYVCVTDLDEDGDLDVVSISGFETKIAWYENFNGLFGPEQIILIDNSYYASSMDAADIDGDGDNDIAVSSDVSILWYKNEGNNNFIEATITTNVSDAKHLYISDLDGDSNLDITSASYDDDKIAWYENVDGFGNFGPQVIVSESKGTNGVSYASPVDLDSDGNLDIISTSKNDSKIAWYKNLDGNGNFGIQHIISTNINGASIACSGDIDGDGDADIVGGSDTSGTLAWFENSDGQGNFGAEQIITTNMIDINSISAIDIDGDGDLDLLCSASSYFLGKKITWFENIDSNGTFGPEQDIENENGSYAQPADVDGDGDIDIIGFQKFSNSDLWAWYENEDGLGNFVKHDMGENFYNFRMYVTDKDGDGDIDFIASNGCRAAWFINLNGSGSFSQPQAIDYYSTCYYYLALADLDGDGDKDLIGGGLRVGDRKLLWRENLDGQGSFGGEHIILENVDFITFIDTGDLNDDGDIDIILSSDGDDKIAWLENTGPLNVPENSSLNILIYPNPTTGIINIQSKETIVSVIIYNQLGQLILEESNVEGINRVNIEKLNEGIYFVKLKTINAEVIIKKLVKK